LPPLEVGHNAPAVNDAGMQVAFVDSSLAQAAMQQNQVAPDSHQFDNNLYATKKSITQTALNASIISTNVAALFNLYRRKNNNETAEFFVAAVTILIISTLSEVVNGLIAVKLITLNINTDHETRASARDWNILSMYIAFFSLVMSIILTAGSFVPEVPMDDDNGTMPESP
jgi:hypothetical protein